jgi:hypothetical protein
MAKLTVKSNPLGESWREGDETWSPVANTDGGSDQFTTPMTESSKSSFVFTPAMTNSSFIFTPAISSSKPSVYEFRSRASSPAAQISKHAIDSRDRRKTQFLDRIRTRREKVRDERIGDQVLRMDYVKERRMWEEKMRRAAEAELEEFEVHEEMAEGDASTIEEKEIEEFVSYLQAEQARVDPDHTEAEQVHVNGYFGMDELADEDYDEAFMEVLSGQHNDDMDMS